MGTVPKSQSCPICGCGYSAQTRALIAIHVLYAAVGTVRKPEPNIIHNPVRYAAVGTMVTVHKPEP